MEATCHLVETLLADIEGGIFLRRTRLDEIYVLLSLVCVCIAAWGVLRLRASGRTARKSFVAFTVAWFAGVITLAVIDIRTLKDCTREEHIIEWLSAEMLLVASVLGLVATIRLARRGEPSPMALFLTSGFALACVRELEWIRPFFGGKIWYSRNLFRLQAYLDPGYFDKFIKSEGLSQKPLPLYPAHLIFSGVMIVVAAIVVIYLVRRRKKFLEQLRELPRTTYGRYFFLGLAGYVGAQAVVGELFEKLLDTDTLAAWRSAHGVGHGIATEPVELWSAACLLMSMLMLWSDNIADKNQHRPEANIDCI